MKSAAAEFAYNLSYGRPSFCWSLLNHLWLFGLMVI